MDIIARTTKQAAASCVALLISASASSASPPTAQERYELQRACGQQAREWFKGKYGDDGSVQDKWGQSAYSFENHYNSKLNTCVVLLTDYDYRNMGTRTTFVTLLDLNQNKTLAAYIEYTSGPPGLYKCTVGEQQCASKEQWDGLVKPYLEQ
jgi:hypothetical protein